MNVNAAALIQATRGPILLIALGTLFAIDHMGLVIGEAGPLGFPTTWPVLIILYGVLRLLERLAAGRQKPVPAGQLDDPRRLS